jgi:predicted ATP-dependent endonuclease of OLD family
MKLKTAQVMNFKSVLDSGQFNIDEKITCLVGKNESGKTALLQALNKINPLVESENQFYALEYPRDKWSEYKERAENDPDDTITWQQTSHRSVHGRA